MKVWSVLLGVGLLVGLFLLISLLVMYLINIVLGYYEVKEINYMSAVAISALAGIFSGFVSASNGK